MKVIDIIIEGYNENGICVGCLNYNRKMIYHEVIKECFSTLADIDIPDGQSVQLCWECLASVRRAWQFRSQILKSYNILNCYSRTHTFLNSPSDLTQYSTTRLSLSEVEINEDIKFQPVLRKEDIDDDKYQVKLELGDELVDFETLKTEYQIFDHDEDFQFEDFSQEPEPSSEDDVQLSKLKQRKERKKVKKRGKSNEEEVLHLPKKRKSDYETGKEILKSQAPLKRTDKGDENKAQNEDNRKIPDFKIRSKKNKAPIKTIITNNGTTTSDINSDINNSQIERNSNERVIAPNNIYICDVCKKEYLYKSLLEYHIKKWHIIKIDSKPNSLTDSNTNYEISKNTKDVLKNNNVTENKLSKNKNKHKDSICSGETQYKCSFCSKCFAANSNLAAHVRIHTGEKPHKCSYCIKSFTRKGDLATHVRIHTGEKPYKCSYCTKCFTRSGILTAHVRIHTGEKPYKCSYCTKCFKQRNDLDTHVRIHTGEKPYKCSYCTKCFKQRNHLDTHVRIHTGEKPYKCSYCTKCFITNLNLATHVRIHTGEKPYKCSYCTKCFKQRHHLDKHVRIHTEKKPYKCSYCTKCFITNINLAAHVRIHHTGEESYKCCYCSKCFADNSNLAAHVRIHTGEKPLQM